MTVPDKLQDEPIFIPIPRQRGKQATIEFADPDKRVTYDEIDHDTHNAAVIAGPIPDTGYTLVILDIDQTTPGIQDRLDQGTLDRTFTVTTAHDNEHRYYLVPTEHVERFQDQLGVDNPCTACDRIKTKNSYVVTAGSWYQAEDCDDCDGGRHEYTADDHPIKTINRRALNHLYIPPNDEGNNRSSNSGSETAGENTSDRTRKPPGLPYAEAKHVINQSDTWGDAAKFNALMKGRWQARDEYPSQSEADLALCHKLAFRSKKFYGEYRDDIIDAGIRVSGLYRPKWERDDYRERTIAKGIKLAKKNWNPGPRKTDHAANVIDDVIGKYGTDHGPPVTVSQFNQIVRRYAETSDQEPPSETANGRALSRRDFNRKQSRSRAATTEGRTRVIPDLSLDMKKAYHDLVADIGEAVTGIENRCDTTPDPCGSGNRVTLEAWIHRQSDWVVDGGWKPPPWEVRENVVMAWKRWHGLHVVG